LVWVKNNKVGFLNTKKQPMRSHESILIFGQPGFKNKTTYIPQKKPGGRKAGTRTKNNSNSIYRLEGGYTSIMDGTLHPCSVLYFDNERGNNRQEYHPTQKPVALMEHLIRSYTNEGDIIIDPFCGSGSTALACIKRNRRFIGVEKEPKYFRMAVERIKSVWVHDQ
jgi:site-specific DNA-methyltransferase (adenine-specific)